MLFPLRRQRIHHGMGAAILIERHAAADAAGHRAAVHLLLLLLGTQLRVEGDGALVFCAVDDAVGERDFEVVAGGVGAEVGGEDVLDVGALLVSSGEGCGSGGGLLGCRWAKGRGVSVVLGDGEVGRWRGGGWGDGCVGEGETPREERGEVVVVVVDGCPRCLLLAGRRGCGDEVRGGGALFVWWGSA